MHFKEIFTGKNMLRIQNCIEKCPKNCSRSDFYGLKNSREHLRPFYNAVFNADSKSVFKNFLSCLKRKKSELKIFQIISLPSQYF